MWLYGEVLQSLPVPSRKILIDLPIKPPQEGICHKELMPYFFKNGSQYHKKLEIINSKKEVRYPSKCDGFNFGEGRTLIWRTRNNQLELFDYSPTGQSEAILVQFPRYVQIYSHVSISKTKRGLALLIISQASSCLIPGCV